MARETILYSTYQILLSSSKIRSAAWSQFVITPWNTIKNAPLKQDYLHTAQVLFKFIYLLR